jgi:hypothetical protein
VDAAGTPILLVHGFIGNHAIFACGCGLLHMNPALPQVGAIHKLQRWCQPSMNASIAATRSLAEVKVRGGWLGG